MTKLFDNFISLHQQSIYYPYSDAKVFNLVIEKMTAPFKKEDITKVVGLEARGFLLAGAIARELRCGCIFVRKGGSIEKIDYKPKYKIQKRNFFDYSGKAKCLELESDPQLFSEKDRYLIIDDWIATGSQLKATTEMIEKIGQGKIIGISVILNSLPKNFYSLPEFNFLKKYTFHSLIKL